MRVEIVTNRDDDRAVFVDGHADEAFGPVLGSQDEAEAYAEYVETVVGPWATREDFVARYGEWVVIVEEAKALAKAGPAGEWRAYRRLRKAGFAQDAARYVARYA